MGRPAGGRHSPSHHWRQRGQGGQWDQSGPREKAGKGEGDGRVDQGLGAQQGVQGPWPTLPQPPELPLTPWPQSSQESPQICTTETGPGAALTHCPSVPRVQGWRPPGSPRHLRPAFTYSSSVLSRGSLGAFLTNVSLWDGEEGPPQQGSAAQPPPRRGSRQSSAPPHPAGSAPGSGWGSG